MVLASPGYLPWKATWFVPGDHWNVATRMMSHWNGPGANSPWFGNLPSTAGQAGYPPFFGHGMFNRHNAIGNIFYGSNGYLAGGNEDGFSYESWVGSDQRAGPRGKSGSDHFANFIDCVRSRKAENLNAPIEEGHISCALVHLAGSLTPAEAPALPVPIAFDRSSVPSAVASVLTASSLSHHRARAPPIA